MGPSPNLRHLELATHESGLNEHSTNELCCLIRCIPYGHSLLPTRCPDAPRLAKFFNAKFYGPARLASCWAFNQHFCMQGPCSRLPRGNSAHRARWLFARPLRQRLQARQNLDLLKVIDRRGVHMNRSLKTPVPPLILILEPSLSRPFCHHQCELHGATRLHQWRQIKLAWQTAICSATHKLAVHKYLDY
ncbi:unannotated protein [freshwater metagenome]|uniref:Unannotated protein n=1 Tax=freshwater metagenome TaxID=449393 RepID=A0A6J6BNS0_9ZZZZ